MEGILSADLRATGPLDQPVLAGRIGLSNGMIRLPSSGARYQKIDLSAELGDQEIRIDRASVTSGSGTAEIRGSVALQGFRAEQLDITARMDRFLAWSTPLVSATLTGDLSLTGSLDEPRVAGNLNLEGSKVGLDDVSAGSEVQAVELTEADYQMLEEYFGYTADRRKAEPSRALERLGLDLALSFDRDVWVSRSRQPRITLEMRGELEIEKDPGEGFRVVGTVETLPERSYFRQFGRRFSVQEGEVTLSGDPTEFSFRMDARWEVPSYSNPDESEVVVNLEVVGNAESLELTLSSEPEMDEADIVSYLATGKPQNALVSSEADAQGLGTSMAVGAMAGLLEGIASEAVELDVVEIKVDPVKGTTLVAGRYVSPDLYLGFRQPVTFSESNKRTRSENQSSEVEVEYRWFRWLTMNVQGGASELRLFLKARYAY
jgi:translocation and assembly module TamB